MNEKQQQLTFDKGITNVPSDALCSDNSLSECVGMVYDNGEHKPIQKPNQFMTVSDGTVIFVHRPNSQTENYIVKKDQDLVWGINNNGTFAADQTPLLTGITATDIQVTAIGKTLIVNIPNISAEYFTWKGVGTGYERLDNNIPEIEIDFRLADFAARNGVEDQAGADPPRRNTFECLKCSSSSYVPEFDYDDGRTGQQGYNNVAVGLYAEVRKKLREKKYFVGPFFVRAAIKLYDGTYTKMTPPTLIVPTMGDNSISTWDYDRNDPSYLYMNIYSGRLQYKLKNQNLSDYSDLISDVVLFVTSEIETIDRDADAIIPCDQQGHVVSIYAATNDNKRLRHSESLQGRITEYDDSSAAGWCTWSFLTVLHHRSAADINADLEESGIFYKLAEIGTTESQGWQDAADKIRDHVMENLTTQDRLTDEYFGHSRVSGQYAYVYNGRLNLANVRRTLFEGFSSMIPYDYVDDGALFTYGYHIFVDIATVDGKVTVMKSARSSERLGMWFYYPDTRAKHVKIFRDNDLIVDEDLKEHKELNGAYYFYGLPVDNDYAPTGTTPQEPPSYTIDPIEELNNIVITSEVNNPYVFNATGYNQVGEGTVLAVVSNTYALSQGQFGQYPLIVFTTKGIWAMNTDNTGLFVSSTPLSREVCNNADSITQTDGSIFFSSQKGLMVLVGADVKCMSEQFKGAFQDFLETAKIAYDYRDALLWIFGDKASSYVYAIKSATLHKPNALAQNDTVAISVVNDYPDNIIQVGSNVYSLTGKPEEHNDTLTYDAVMETRPMKLENALALKSIMQVRHVYQFAPYTVNGETQRGSMTLRIFASNNLDSWIELHSLRGTPWKYYKFRFDFSNLKATDRFAGTTLITQERRSNKLR